MSRQPLEPVQQGEEEGEGSVMSSLFEEKCAIQEAEDALTMKRINWKLRVISCYRTGVSVHVLSQVLDMNKQDVDDIVHGPLSKLEELGA